MLFYTKELPLKKKWDKVAEGEPQTHNLLVHG